MYIIVEIQLGEYNGNVWGPYETRKEAEEDSLSLSFDTNGHAAGPFTYRVMEISRFTK